MTVREVRDRRDPAVTVVGAGMSGLCMAAMLRRAGYDDIVVLEKAESLGGTWRDNRYPGLTCDVPAHFYEYSFAPKPDWSHNFATGDEIRRYLEDVADAEGVRGAMRFGEEVESARFEEGRWHVRTASGFERTSDFLVCATGVLHQPRVPEIEGLDTFAGAVFHSARWDPDVEISGRRLGVVGTGSTAVQIATEVARDTAHLDVFQRTPQWIFPWPNFRHPDWLMRLLARHPGLDRLSYHAWRAAFEWFAGAIVKPGLRRRAIQAICRQHLERSVKDPELRRRLTPDYQPLCKRLVISSGFYRAIQRPTVDIVTEAIERVEPEGVRTRDGVLHPLDVLVLATGFDAHAYMRPMEIVGRDGVSLDEAWRGGPRAYLTVALPQFPNLFTLMGPHSPVGNTALVPIAESQAAFAIEWIDRWRDGLVDHVEPTHEATTRTNDAMREAMPNTVWTTGCDSWYLDENGVPAVWPWTPTRHRHALAEIAEEDFAVVAGGDLRARPDAVR